MSYIEKFPQAFKQPQSSNIDQRCVYLIFLPKEILSDGEL